METNSDILSNAIESFGKYISQFTSEEIDKDLKKYDTNSYSGYTISEIKNFITPNSNISQKFIQENSITIDQFGIFQYCLIDIGEGIKIKSKIESNPQSFAGYFF
jgi:hypothetical protein